VTSHSGLTAYQLVGNPRSEVMAGAPAVLLRTAIALKWGNNRRNASFDFKRRKRHSSQETPQNVSQPRPNGPGLRAAH